ncbi:hypothetical protein [Mycoplasmoides gallisepticum]|nr:hypothetical protein [Mycoplasmoides gallisepticum]
MELLKTLKIWFTLFFNLLNDFIIFTKEDYLTEIFAPELLKYQ